MKERSDRSVSSVSSASPLEAALTRKLIIEPDFELLSKTPVDTGIIIDTIHPIKNKIRKKIRLSR